MKIAVVYATNDPLAQEVCGLMQHGVEAIQVKKTVRAKKM